MNPSPLAAPLVQTFFVEHLLDHKGVSPRTVSTYRDTFRLLLRFLHTETGIAPTDLRLRDLDAPRILAFLDHLERCRHNGARSRNLRLATIRSFFRYVALREPLGLSLATRVLAIPTKRAPRRLIGYLTREEIEAVLPAPDRSSQPARRDHTLLLTLYNTGARVSELAALRWDDVQYGPCPAVLLRGKERKQRTVPLWSRTTRALQLYRRELTSPPALVFLNARGRPLSRHGVLYILRQAVRRAIPHCSALHNKKISPHTLRHTTAMHLLEAGVDLSVIALWLGHEQLETTHMYVEADLTMKQRALAQIAPHGSTLPRFRANDKLLAFLTSL